MSPVVVFLAVSSLVILLALSQNSQPLHTSSLCVFSSYYTSILLKKWSPMTSVVLDFTLPTSGTPEVFVNLYPPLQRSSAQIESVNFHF